MTQAQTQRGRRFPPQLWSELGGVMLMASEALWAALFYRALTRTEAEPALVALALAAAGVASHYLSRLSSGRKDRTRRRQVLFGVWVFMVLAFTARVLYLNGEPVGIIVALGRAFTGLFADETRVGAAAHLLITALLIFRGVRLARTPITIGFNHTSFRVSAGAFLLFGAVYSHELSTAAYVTFAAYLFMALSGLTFNRIAYLGQTRGGKLPPHGWSWLGQISLAVLGTVTLAVLAGYLISGRAAYALATAFVSLLGYIAIGLSYLLAPVMQVVIGLIMRLLERSPGSDLLAAPQRREGFNQAGEEIARDQEIISDIIQVLQAVLPIVILVIVVLLIVTSLGWRPFSRKPAAEEDEVAAASPAAKNRQEDEPNRLRRWFNPRRMLAAARIRRIYAQLEDLSERLESARPPAATPLEFLPRLVVLFPEEQENLRLITHAYLRVRYGETPEDPREVEAVAAAWKAVSQRGHGLLAQKKAADKSRPRS